MIEVWQPNGVEASARFYGVQNVQSFITMTRLGVESFEDQMQNFNGKGLYREFFTTGYHEKGKECTYSMKHQEDFPASLKWEILLSDGFSACGTCYVATNDRDGSEDSTHDIVVDKESSRQK